MALQKLPKYDLSNTLSPNHHPLSASSHHIRLRPQACRQMGADAILNPMKPQAATLKRHEDRIKTLHRIMKRHPEADAENVWHTLVLLELPPIERLRRGLLRAQKPDLH
jgi:hypothetical protein